MFLTLSKTPALVIWLRDAGHLTYTVYFGFFLATSVVMGGAFRFGRLKSSSLWAALCVALLAYAFTAYTVGVAEQLHLLTYGVMSILIFNLGRFRWGGGRLFILSAVITAVIGLLDELLQHFLPNRGFDWLDVLINAIGGVTALILVRYVPGDRGERCFV